MNSFQDSRFGKLYEPSSFDELIKCLRPKRTGLFDVYMWRGQADESWLLHSAAFRKLSLSKAEPNESEIVSYEKRLLEKATHKGFRLFNGRELSDWELLARLQHHGAATRLIDTTRSALVGLFFACWQRPTKPGLLFGISCDHLGGGEGHLLTETYEERFKSIARYDHPQTWEPPVVSPRVYAQHSQFVYSTTKLAQSYGSLALGDISKSLLTVRIPARLKSKYARILSQTFDIHRLSLVPDLDGFGSAFSVKLEQWSVERW